LERRAPRFRLQHNLMVVPSVAAQRWPSPALPAGVGIAAHHWHTPTVQSRAQFKAAPAASECKALLG